jgi:hypothetical protein
MGMPYITKLIKVLSQHISKALSLNKNCNLVLLSIVKYQFYKKYFENLMS